MNRTVQLNVSQRLRTARLRPTSSRAGILRIIESMPGRFSVEDVYKQLLIAELATSVGTVYRVLGDFELAGIVKRHWVHGLGGPKAVFSVVQARQLAEPARTHRLLCTACNHSVAIQDPAALELLNQFAGSGLDPSQEFLTLKVDACTNCRTSGLPRNDTRP